MRPIEALPVGPLQFIENAALLCSFGAAAYIAVDALRARPPWPNLQMPALLRRGITLLGATVALSASPVVAKSRPLPPGPGAGPMVAPPWSDASGPPPRLLGPIGGANPGPHPALHPSRQARVREPLFPRATASSSEEAERRRSMAAHPAGTALTRRGSSNSVVVRDGDTLWGLAAELLGSDDAARIARYWPAIHRHNRAIIGPDPNLIRPGQLLQLPPERA